MNSPPLHQVPLPSSGTMDNPKLDAWVKEVDEIISIKLREYTIIKTITICKKLGETNNLERLNVCNNYLKKRVKNHIQKIQEPDIKALCVMANNVVKTIMAKSNVQWNQWYEEELVRLNLLLRELESGNGDVLFELITS